ncbi:MAG TPA: hypothetical protein DFI00_01415 [Rhodospirillaceae bacterium]|nr:hypothetical protein [Alphaproteobacteria bacterium]OUT41634.1 MAG: hypothetical protein CBB62_04710 [Micavibrio sp. TMED2]HCI45931.1 hypothetical protein [Rhodospirillaceae bacterium]MAS46801.1 hypothetical protein [Alphaproteobacteria bacterium]MAX94896.1 hypothetical protein [Alphaproteobacteria bacterium]|tara:strand:- start:59081 stop:59359 length:279 start_codon:yes stop_codon:yes gene_type:complete
MQTYQFAHFLKGLLAGSGDTFNRGQFDELTRVFDHVQPDENEPEELKAHAWMTKRIKAINEAPNEEREALLLKRLHRDLSNDFAKHEPANDS